jgi:glycosyltransferase involved in cell wall biosynthesis
MDIKFTVAIPAFKSKFLKDCIQSVLSQDYPNLELIILNDCSPEPVGEIVKSFSDERIRYYLNEINAGGLKLVENWNKCLQLSEGDFIVILGDDDRFEINYLSEFKMLIEKYPVLDIFHCRSRIIDENDNVIELTQGCPEFESVYDHMNQRMIGNRQQFISDFVYRRDSLQRKGGFYYLPYAWGSDDITGFIAGREKGIANTNKPVFNYRRSKYSISNNRDIENKLIAVNQMKDWFQSFFLTVPTDTDDQVTYEYLEKNITRILQKRKINLITKDMQSGFLYKLFFWQIKRKKHGISQVEFFYALQQYLIYLYKN